MQKKMKLRLKLKSLFHSLLSVQEKDQNVRERQAFT